MLNKTQKTKLFGVLAAISATCFLTPTPVRADNSQYIYEVGEQLAKAAIASGLGGYTLTHEPSIDLLTHGRSDYITVNLRAGTSYGIVGVCDRDCRDLDIALYDSRGNLIASDLQNDDIPTISINPTRSGTYRVRVDMASCNTSACYYGIGVFGQ
ncbi:hypothetical protein DSM106972_047330 [Dulcicalothrix desertica PCC 7102]|uniref:Peptidase C-terminal archaeal/bacterial domain-containing protein n=1 Tax=Dulcicalothrix desertica PCC 7102 TaxID=232991 RepID=A0A433VCS0_9CYAN|nr:PPC domain-containing protein [Dulcicalothrix desertica]RUT03819.1 hypothetical protein DSM106972_047330 [Dulcicalothrix desertica PCC 7102]TWH43772.1 pre-peptidase [Dulcicalothrix desertica PCC 7102]